MIKTNKSMQMQRTFDRGLWNSAVATYEFMTPTRLQREQLASDESLKRSKVTCYSSVDRRLNISFMHGLNLFSRITSELYFFYQIQCETEMPAT